MLKGGKYQKYARPAGILLIVLTALLVAVLADHHTKSQVTSACGPYRNDTTVTINGQKLNTEVVESPAEQAKGLSGRPCIDPNEAMLFVHRGVGQYPIWMKNMKFPIDIIWISPDHRVAGIERNVAPSTYPDSFTNDKHHLASFVLELKANRSVSLGINALGTPVIFQR